MLEFKGVSKRYLYGARVINALDLKIDDGEIVSIYGETGSGKTTFIKVASCCTDFDGEIYLNGEKVKLKSNDTMVVFDDLALFTNKSTYYNLAYPLRIRGFSKDVIDNKIKEVADKLNIYALLYSKVSKLSLIDKKRIGLARMYLRDVKVIYVDDITSNLSYLDEKILFDEFKNIVLDLSKKGVTIIYSTSIKEEAIAISDRIIVMHYNEIKQIGSFDEIYNKPQNIWAAEAVDEYYNFEKAKLIDNNGLKLCFNEIEIDANCLKEKFLNEYVDKDIYVGWHAEDVSIEPLRVKDVDIAKRINDLYLLSSNGINVLSKNKEKTISTLPNIEKVTLFDFYSESSIMK